MAKRYEVILFDLGNTIIRFDHNISARKIANLCGVSHKFIYETFFDSEITRLFDAGMISPKEFYLRVSGHLGIALPYRDFVDIWNDIFWEDQDAIGLARELEGEYRLFLMSNINKLHFEYIIERFKSLEIFSEIILSYIVGALKPDMRIYEHARGLAGVDFSKLFYIDDRDDLVREAQALGIDSVRFENAGKLRELLIEKKILTKP